MSTTVALFDLDDSFARELTGLYEPWRTTPVEAPELVVLNGALAAELGVDPTALRGPDGVAVLAGNAVPEGATPLAQAYAGHQFGGYSPRLGDGRALLIGEVVDQEGHRRDLHLKGSGRTPFARGGDGRAALGPMLREYLMGEAMHALGIPTTRALSVVATGERVERETSLPGAVLCRVAASHLRIGSFQYAAATGDADLLASLTRYAIGRHHPECADADNPALALFAAVLEAQAELVARWMLVGFIHGVLNTDNVTISGETIDYGPCAFMDTYDPATVFSSIDHAGRYAYGNQPQVTQWNLARFAETLLGVIDPDPEKAVEVATPVLETFPDRFRAHWEPGLLAKIGLGSSDDEQLGNDLLALLHTHRVDWTSSFRSLSDAVRGDGSSTSSMFDEPDAFDAWAKRWRRQLELTGVSGAASTDTADAMDRVNPVYVPRNHLVEETLDAATVGDLGPFETLLDVLADPWTVRTGRERFAAPAPSDFGPYRTFCGT